MTYEDKYANETFMGPSMETCQARAKAAFTKRCSCGSKRDPSEVKQAYNRRWISCLRCLGTIRQLSDREGK